MIEKNSLCLFRNSRLLPQPSPPASIEEFDISIITKFKRTSYLFAEGKQHREGLFFSEVASPRACAERARQTTQEQIASQYRGLRLLLLLPRTAVLLPGRTHFIHQQTRKCSLTQHSMCDSEQDFSSCKMRYFCFPSLKGSSAEVPGNNPLC